MLPSPTASVRGETVFKSQESATEEQIATINLSLDEISQPRSPAANELETRFDSSEITSDVVHSLSGEHGRKHYSKSMKQV